MRADVCTSNDVPFVKGMVQEQLSISTVRLQHLSKPYLICIIHIVLFVANPYIFAFFYYEHSSLFKFIATKQMLFF